VSERKVSSNDRMDVELDVASPSPLFVSPNSSQFSTSSEADGKLTFC